MSHLTRMTLATFLLVAVCLAKGAPLSACAASISQGPFAACFVAAEPAAEVLGPTEVTPGRPAVFNLKGVPPEYLVYFNWQIIPSVNDAMVLDLADRKGNPVLVFWTEQAGKYTVVADVNIPPENFQLITHDFTVAKPNGPKPKPKPDPKPDPKPAVVDFAVVVWEAADPFQVVDGEKVNWGAVLASKTIRESLARRYFPVDDDATNLSASLKAFVARYKADKRAPYPWIYLVDKAGNVLHEQRHPVTAKATVELVEKYK